MNEVNFYYDKKSQNYDEVFGTLYFRVYDAITWKYLEPYVPVDSNKLILDAAGGTGCWAIRMAVKGCKVVLMDDSEGILQAAERKIKGNGFEDKSILKKGDITKTGFADKTFDMVLCEHALFLFAEPDQVIRELERILKRDAPMIISSQNRYVQSLSAVSDKPNVENVDVALKLLVKEEHGHMAKDGKVKTYTWTPEEFRAMLEKCGLRVEKIVGKCISMPLRIKEEVYSKKKFSENFFNKILQFELALCEKPDALALAGHLQATAFNL